MEILAEKFHNVEGATLHDRKKNFSIYLNEIKKTVMTPDGRKSFGSLLKPRTKLEEVQYVNILLELQESDGLLNILAAERNVPMRKMVLNSKLFLDVLRKNFDRVTSDEFSNGICFLVRLRIFIRLGYIFQDDERLDDYYQVIRKKYGPRLAKHLLPACKLHVITEEMEKNRVVFSNKQLTKLHKRFPSFLEDYFKHLKANNFKTFNRFDKLIKHVAKTDMDLYWRLLSTHELRTKLSMSSTAKFVKKYKEHILNSGEKYLEIIHKRTAFKQLTLDEFPQLYSKLFPKSFNDFKPELVGSKHDEIIKTLVQRAPRNHRFTILNDVFQRLYNTNLLDHDELLTETLLEIVPVNLREPVIVRKIAKDDKDDWLAFYELEKGLSMIKAKISKTTDPNKRRNLVSCLIKTCKVNNDIPRLAEVFDYIATRHRNEDVSLFNNVFNELQEMDFGKFNADHWDGLSKICKIYLLSKQDNLYYSDYRINNYTEGLWAYKLQNNLPIVEDLTTYVKKYYKDYQLMVFQDKKYKKERRVVLEMLGEILPGLLNDMGKNVDYQIVGNFFLNSFFYCHDFKAKSRNADIDRHPFIIKYISDVMDNPTDGEYQRGAIFNMVNHLRHIKEAGVYKKVCDELWKDKSECYSNKWGYFLKYHPEYITANYEQFFQLNWFGKPVYDFIENVQYYSHLGIAELYQQRSKELLTGPEYPGHNMKYNAAVRFLANSSEFLAVVGKFLPKKSYDSKAVDEEANVVQIKKTISEVLGNYSNLEDAVAPTLALSKSDYLKYCLQSIYKIVYNVPESKLTHLMEEVASGKVSLRKHRVFLTTRISDQETVYHTLKSFGLNETDRSIQKYVIKSTMAFFSQNPTDAFFDLLQNHCKLLTDYDSEGFDLMLNLDRIPVNYLSKYVEFIWDLTQSSGVDEVREVKYKILQKLDEDLMKTVKPELLDTLVMKCLNFEKQDADKMYDFILRYILIGDLEDVSKRVNFVLSKFPEKTAASDMLLSKNLLKFIIECCEKMLGEHKKGNTKAKNVLKTLKKAWENVFNVENNFDQAVALEITEYFLETDNYNRSLLVEKVAQFLKSVQKYGSYIIPNFARGFQRLFLTLMKVQELQDHEELLRFLLEFLQVKSNIPQIDTDHFVLLSLPTTFPKATIAKEKHLEILKTLEKSDFISVRVNVTCYINSLEEKKDETANAYIPICRMRC